MARRPNKEADPLKMYTVVMALLVLVMAVLYYVIDTKRKAFVEANAEAERLLTGKGVRRGIDDSPKSILELSLAVERLSFTWEQASPGGGGLEGHISQQMMETVAVAAGLHQFHSSGEHQEKGPGGRYETISQDFDYEAIGGGSPEVWRLLTLMWNVESRGRYRVSEVNWEVADPNDNPEAPFDKVKRPRIEVSLRRPSLDAE
jgi:hypothetical protein